MPSISQRVGKGYAGTTLVDFLSAMMDCSRRRAKAILDQRLVHVNHRRIWMARHRLRAGDVVEVAQAGPPPSGRLPILWEQDNLLIINKPAGLEVPGRSGIENRLRDQLDNHTVTAVHRLDRDTTGCLLLARSSEARAAMVEQFRRRKVLKLYRVIVEGHVERDREVRSAVDGLPASSFIHVLHASAAASFLQVRIATGRTHQIRKHLSSIHHPVVGDATYGARHQAGDELRRVPRMMLHAHVMQFTAPGHTSASRIKAPMPRDFKDCLRALSLR